MSRAPVLVHDKPHLVIMPDEMWEGAKLEAAKRNRRLKRGVAKWTASAVVREALKKELANG